MMFGKKLARIVDNLPDGAEPPEIYKSSAARTTTMWLAFQSPSMTDLELTDYADRYLKDLFSTVPGVGNIKTWRRTRIFIKNLA